MLIISGILLFYDMEMYVHVLETEIQEKMFQKFYTCLRPIAPSTLNQI